MANIKTVRIVGDVPFDWLDSTCDLNAETAQVVARALLGPSMGLTHRYELLPGLVENDRGGLTTMYRLTIEGREALSWQFMRLLALAEGLQPGGEAAHRGGPRCGIPPEPGVGAHRGPG